MPETQQADSESEKESKNQGHTLASHPLVHTVPVRLPSGLRWILLGGGSVLAALLAVSVYLPFLSERVKFFTINALSLLVLLTIVVQTYIYRWQWDLMERQLKINRGQALTLEKQAWSLDSQVDMMTDSLMETRKMAEHNERVFEATQRQSAEQMANMQGQLAAMKILAAASEMQAKVSALAVQVSERSAIAVENSVVVAQRAYVLFGTASPDYLTDTLIYVMYQITNFGNTPASYVQTVTRAALLDSQPEGLNPDDVEWTTNEGTVIAPHDSIDRRLEVRLETGQRQLLNERKMRLYLRGLIRYRDIFGNTHLTRFNLVHYPGIGPRFGHCESGNEAD